MNFSLLRHFSKLADGIHILSSTPISRTELARAKELLKEFVLQFQQEYKEGNMVSNVHLLSHLADSVERNGPLFCYSNYCNEDNMGHLLKFMQGTNDVTLQISEKYLMERDLQHNLRNSPRAKEYYDMIQAAQRYSITKKIGRTHVIGRPNNSSQLNSQEMQFIIDSLNLTTNIEIEEYNAVLLNSEKYYETSNMSKRKSTMDSFVSVPERDVYGIIHTFFIVNEHLYFFVYNKYIPVHTPSRATGSSMTWLSNKRKLDYFIFDASETMDKYVFLDDNVKRACVKIPNNLERN